jgi:aryl-phospho-beta-D-glucosidase BglC (GH1 family)
MYTKKTQCDCRIEKKGNTLDVMKLRICYDWHHVTIALSQEEKVRPLN